MSYDIAVVGAGAAGLTAAIFARREAPEARIVALDGAPRIGAKILISGGGRCNITHDVVTPDDFNGNRNVVARVLRTFTVEQTTAWFAEMGVTLKREETGKLFPTTDKARSVVDALLRACEGVEIRTGARVLRCHPERESRDLGGREAAGVGGTAGSEAGPSGTSSERRTFSAPPPAQVPRLTLGMTDGGTIEARRVIVATGGRSVPKTGSDGGGYALVQALGHTITETFPALVPLVLEEGHWITSLSGTSAEVELSVRSETGRVLARERGSMLCTHFGISGPVALDISRHWIASNGGGLFVNFLPGETFESLEALLIGGKTTVASVLRGRLPQRLLDALTTSAPLKSMTKEERRRIVRALVETPLPVVRDRGFDYAEVTAGGVPLSEVDLSTMHSRKCDGLYLCGEILDVDGRIGGYNFQWAWASGRLAGEHAARSLYV